MHWNRAEIKWSELKGKSKKSFSKSSDDLVEKPKRYENWAEKLQEVQDIDQSEADQVTNKFSETGRAKQKR